MFKGRESFGYNIVSQLNNILFLEIIKELCNTKGVSYCFIYQKVHDMIIRFKYLPKIYSVRDRWPTHKFESIATSFVMSNIKMCSFACNCINNLIVLPRNKNKINYEE